MHFKRIRDLREDNDLTQKQIFSYLHCGETTYRKYEKGTLEIPTGKAMKLAKFYDVSLEYLTGRTNEKQSYIPLKFSISSVLRLLRRKHHFSHDYVADYLSCSRPQYSEYEEGKIEISLTMLSMLADLYKVTLDYICGASK